MRKFFCLKKKKKLPHSYLFLDLFLDLFSYLFTIILNKIKNVVHQITK